MPNDHVTPFARLAGERPIVCVEQPSWTVELLALLALLEFAALCMAVGQMRISDKQAEQAGEETTFWMETALAPETLPTVRIAEEGAGFRCDNFRIRREWERAVAAKCQELGGMLIQARTYE